MKNGVYVSGWQFDWRRAKDDVDQLLFQGRDMAMAMCADPGVVTCPACGETHWRQFEVFLCERCGAKVTLNLKKYEDVTAGPPAHPDKVRRKYVNGLRVCWRPVQPTRRGKPNQGGWQAGKVPQGSLGTVKPDPDGAQLFTNPDVAWRVEWDDVAAKDGAVFGLFGPWVDDDLEVIDETAHSAMCPHTVTLPPQCYEHDYASVSHKALLDMLANIKPQDLKVAVMLLIAREGVTMNQRALLQRACDLVVFGRPLL